MNINLGWHQKDVLGETERAVGIGKAVNVGREVTVARCAGRADPGHILLLDNVTGIDIRKGDAALSRLNITRHHDATIRLEDPDVENVGIRQWLQNRSSPRSHRRVGSGQPVVVIKARSIYEYPLHRLVEKQHSIDILPQIAVFADEIAGFDRKGRKERLGAVAPRQGQELEI